MLSPRNARPISTRAALVLLGGAAVLLMGAVVFEGGPDRVIFPNQSNPIEFDHAYHVRTADKAKGIKGEGLACDFCHDKVPESTKAADRDIPGHGACDSCHAEWIGEDKHPAPRKACAHCHKDATATATVSGAAASIAKITIPTPNIRFAHKDHLDAKVQCVECHTAVPEKRIATRDDYPTMDRCIGCHEQRGAPTTCNTCHLTQPSGKLITQFESGKLEPRRMHAFAVHDAAFLRGHAVPAQRDKAYCNNCHVESDCLSCHDNIGRDTRYHPGDWMAVHSIRARQDDVRCQSCHRLQSFCLNCHVRSGVATVVAFDNPNTVLRKTIRVDALKPDQATGPHPMGNDWVPASAGRNFHGFHAQRNIRACASCHQEQYCLRCHQSSVISTNNASGGNPHGPNPERLRNSALRKMNARVCLKCHSPLDQNWQ